MNKYAEAELNGEGGIMLLDNWFAELEYMAECGLPVIDAIREVVRLRKETVRQIRESGYAITIEEK